MKGKIRPQSGYYSRPIGDANADKIAQDIINEDKKSKVAGGLDSSFDSDELDKELRDKVNENDSVDSGDSSDGALLHNTDLTYYDVMNPDEKI